MSEATGTVQVRRLGPAAEALPDEQAKPFGIGPMLGVTGVLLAAFVAGIDERLTTIGQTDLVGHFGYGADEGSWTATAYLVGEVIVLPFAPRLASAFSPRRVGAVLIVIATLAGTACSAAPSYPILIALRTCQGIGDGGLAPVLLTTLMHVVPRRFKPEVSTIFAGLLVTVGVVSPSIEGTMVTLFTFRGLFWMMTLAGPVAVTLVLAGLPTTPPKWSLFREDDKFGMVVLAAAAGFLVVGLSQGQRLDWFSSPFEIAAFALAGWFLVVFVCNELAVGDVAQDLLLAERHSFLAGLGLTFLIAMALLSTDYLLPQDQIAVRGMRPLQIGDMELWLLVAIGCSGVATATALRALDSRVVVLTGMVLLIGGLWPMAWLTPVWDGDDAEPWITVATAGATMALGATVFGTMGMIEEKRFGIAAVLFNLFRAFGFIAGGAVLEGILVVRTRVHSDEAIAAHLDLARPSVRMRIATDGIAALDRSQSLQASVMALADSWGWLTLFVLLGVPLIAMQRAGTVGFARRRK